MFAVSEPNVFYCFPIARNYAYRIEFLHTYKNNELFLNFWSKTKLIKIVPP